MPTAVFVVGYGPHTGLGHVRRSSVLATELTGRGWRCEFLLSTLDTHVDVLREFRVAAWPTQLLDVPPAELLVCDAYDVGAAVLSALRSRFRLILVIDDLGNRPLVADLILNHNINGADISYAHVAGAEVLAGVHYALVPPDLAALAGVKRPLPPRVLVSFGGTDDGTISAPVAAALVDLRLNVDWALAVTQPLNEVAEALAAREAGRLRLFQGADMVERMREASCYVGAAGYTALEASAAGLSLCLCAITSNQELALAAFAKRGVCTVVPFDPSAMAEAASRLMRARNGHMPAPVCDGHGARRVADRVDQRLEALA